jgi:hypothetical protein
MSINSIVSGRTRAQLLSGDNEKLPHFSLRRCVSGREKNTGNVLQTKPEGCALVIRRASGNDEIHRT